MLGLMGSLLTLRWRIASIVAGRNVMSADTLETLTMSFSRLDQDWWQIAAKQTGSKTTRVGRRRLLAATSAPVVKDHKIKRMRSAQVYINCTYAK